MKLYLAGGPKNQTVELLANYNVKHKLYSYHNEKELATAWGSKGLILDSGAFSAFTRGVDIDIDELIAYIKELKPEVAVQLDVIGDEDQTWRNYTYMSKQVDVVPVIGYKASDKHIKRVLASADYIFLGGLVPLSTRQQKLTAWLDYLYTKYNLIDYKVHLLGVSNVKILSRYPAYSADSSSATRLYRYPSNEIKKIVSQKHKHYWDLYEIGIKEMLEIEQYITKLWESRGIKWD